MRALLGLGSNLGQREYFLQACLQNLFQLGYSIDAWSAVYASEPIEGCTQPFLNACAIVSGDFQAKSLLCDLLHIEKILGRDRSLLIKDRCIDLDILLFQNSKGQALAFHEKQLIVPHPRMLQRDFVLVPACDIAKDWQLHPDTPQTLGDAFIASSLCVVDFQLLRP